MTDPKLRQQVLERDGFICQNWLHNTKSKGGKDTLKLNSGTQHYYAKYVKAYP
jgi:hypothetical protein